MNDRSDIDRVLGYWLEDGPVAMPDRVIDVVAHRISIRPQRRSRRLLRRYSMNPLLKYGAAAAAVLVIAIASYNLLPGNGIGGPDPSPTASPASTVPATTGPTTAGSTAPATVCDEPEATCSGLLPAGANTTVAFQPKLTFTLPRTGWTNTLDKARAYTIHYNFTRGHFLQLLSQVAIPGQNAACTPEWKAGVGDTVAGWVDFLTSHAGLEATAPKAIKVGGYDGMQLDVHVSSDWTATCPNSLGPAVVLMTHSGAQPETSRWIDDQQVTMRIIDVAGETVIVYLESSPVAADLAALNTEFEPFFASLQFTPGS